MKCLRTKNGQPFTLDINYDNIVRVDFGILKFHLIYFQLIRAQLSA